MIAVIGSGSHVMNWRTVFLKNVIIIILIRWFFIYSKVSFIKPGRSRLLEFDSTGRLIETFSKYLSRPGCLIKTKN